jgi:hypothetical protein
LRSNKFTRDRNLNKLFGLFFFFKQKKRRKKKTIDTSKIFLETNFVIFFNGIEKFTLRYIENLPEKNWKKRK